MLNDVPDSRVSDRTRARVRAAAEALGHVPHLAARSLRAGRSNLVLIPLHTLPAGPLLDRFFDEMAARLHDLGYVVNMPADRTERGARAARQWASLRPFGLIVESERLNREALAILRSIGVRVVLGMGLRRSPLVPTVITDQAMVGARAAEHLTAKGHKRLAVIVPSDARLKTVGLERLAGVERVCRSTGADVEQVNLSYDESAAAILSRRWSNGTHPTGVFCYNDEYAMLLMRALLDAGVKIPSEIALVGADNLPLCTLLRPRLTSVRIDAGNAGHSVAQVFDELARGRDAHPHEVELLQAEVIPRETT